MSLTLAKRLGTSSHLSPLMQKARRLGALSPNHLEEIAIARGLRYFGQPSDLGDQSASKSINPTNFTNGELAIALMSPTLPYSLTRLRMAGAMLAAESVTASEILRLARLERCESIVRHIAECAYKVEPLHPLWASLLENLPNISPAPPDILPHPTRFVAMSGIDRTGRSNRIQWIRPTP